MGAALHERIANDEFVSHIHVGPQPRMPVLLRKRASELTDTEIQGLPAIREAYEADLKVWKDLKARRREEDLRLTQEFYLALCKDNGVPHDHRFIQRCWQRAWDRGHSAGQYQVKIEFEELLELWEEYNRV